MMVARWYQRGHASMAEAEKKFTLRLPEDLHAALSRMAAEDDRSLHSMVVRILREAAERRQEETGGHPKVSEPAASAHRA